MDLPAPPPAPGAPPPGFPGAKPAGGTGPAAAGAAAPAAAQQGVAAVKAGLELLQKGLPQIPMGSKLHQAVLKAVSDIGKHLSEEGGPGGKDPAAMIQEMMNLARQAKLNPAASAPPMGGPPPAMPPAAPPPGPGM